MSPYVTSTLSYYGVGGIGLSLSRGPPITTNYRTMTLPKITPKQHEILNLLYRYRFLNRIQIQFFLNHKYHKRINDWLNDLTNKSYLCRIYSKKLPDNIKPAIYYISNNAIRLLKTQKDCSPEFIRKLYREKDRSKTFIDQCILLGDICLTLRDEVNKKRDDGKTVWHEYALRADFMMPDSSFNFLSELQPHLLAVKHEKKKRTKDTWYLLEIFEPTIPNYLIRKRLKTYLEFYWSSEWESSTNLSFPTILFVCSTTAMLIYAKRYARKLIQEADKPNDLIIRFATAENVKASGVMGKIWES